MKSFEKFIEYLAENRENMTDEDAGMLCDELVRIAEEKCSFIFPALVDKDVTDKYGQHICSEKMEREISFEFSPAHITDDNGNKWLVAFTSHEKIINSPTLTTMTGYANLVFELLVAEETEYAGMIINPEDSFFPISGELIKYATEYEENADENIFDYLDTLWLVHNLKDNEILEIYVHTEPREITEFKAASDLIIEAVSCNDISAVIIVFENGDVLQFCGEGGLFYIETVKVINDKPEILNLKMKERAELNGEYTYAYCGTEIAEKLSAMITKDKLCEIIAYLLSNYPSDDWNGYIAEMCRKLNLDTEAVYPESEE